METSSNPKKAKKTCRTPQTKRTIKRLQEEQRAAQHLLQKQQYLIEFNQAALKKAATLNSKGIRCYLCHGEFGIDMLAPTRDHVTPKSTKNSPHKGWRTRWAHYRCNQEKENMPLDFFRMLKIFMTHHPDFGPSFTYKV